MLSISQTVFTSLVGVLFGLIALSCLFGCTNEEPTTTPDGTHLVSRMLLDWTYAILSLVLVFIVLVVNMFDLFKNNKSPVLLVLLSLTAPGLPSAFHYLQVLFSHKVAFCGECFLASMSIQLVISALSIACLYGKQISESHQALLTSATSIFFIAATGASSLALKPTLVAAGHRAGLWEQLEIPAADVVSPTLLIFVGYIMQFLLLLRYHTKYSIIPQYTSRGYISATVIYSLALLTHSTLLRMALLNVGVLMPILGLIWDMAATQRHLLDGLAAAQHESLHWQGVASLLKEANAMTETSINSKSAFVSGLANEMKTIAHSTSVLISLLNDTDIQPNQNVYISKLEKAIEKLANLIREAQFYSDIEAQRASIEAIFFRLDQLLEEVIASTTLRTLFEERDVDVAYLIDPSVPINLMGDSGRLKNLLLRLLSNAIKSTIQGEVIILVKVESDPQKIANFNQTTTVTNNNNNNVSAHTNNSTVSKQPLFHGLEGDMVLLSLAVEDTGIGIAPEDIDRIFEPFGLVNHKREDGDLGLGLSICKQLARLFGGTLTVQSELSKGTVFTLLCPFRAQQQGMHGHPLNYSASISTAFNVGTLSTPWSGGGMLGSALQRKWGVGKTVCVIDDNPNIGAVCRMHLDSVGCDVLFHTNPAEALAELRERANDGKTCDAVLIDYRIPGSSGEEVARSIRSDSNLKSIPLVLMCTVKQRKLIALPNTHFLYKPLKKEPLLTVLHMLCTTSRENERPDFALQHTSSHHAEAEFIARSATPPPASPEHHHPSQPVTTPTSDPHDTVVEGEKRSTDTEPERTSPPPSLAASSALLPPTPIGNSPAPNLRSPSSHTPPTSTTSSPRSLHHTPSGEVAVVETDNVHPSTKENSTESAPPTPHNSAPSSPPSQHLLVTTTSDDGNGGNIGVPFATAPLPTTTPIPALTPVPAPTPTPSSRKETILLVEDNPINAKIASAVLRRHSFEVELASNGQVALERVKKNHDHFQLILMDIHMPIMDGLTCAHLVRQFEKDNGLNTIPIIALTADTTPGHRSACLEAGCNEFMSKPLDYPLLIEILKKLNPG